MKSEFDVELSLPRLLSLRKLHTKRLSSSMPSGHAAGSAAGAVILAYLLGRWGWALGLLAAAVAYGRVYIGVHYPGDVLAGAALGVVVGLAAVALVSRLQPTSAAPPRSAEAKPEG